MTDTVTIKGRYLRRHNLGNYEHQEAEVEFGGAHANEGALVVAEEMGRRAKMAVERILGFAQTTASGPVISGVQADAYATAEAAVNATRPAEGRRPVGRPKKTEAAKPVDDIPGFEDAAAPAAEQAKPAEEAFDFTDPAPVAAKAEAEEPVTDETLQTVASKTAAALGSADPIKKLMAENYKVKALRELEPYVRKAFVADLAKLVADGKAKK